MLGSADIAALEDLQQLGAVLFQLTGGSGVRCPDCRIRGGKLVPLDGKRYACLCPVCGMTEVSKRDRLGVLLDPLWLARQLRQALQIPADDLLTVLSRGVWQLGMLRRQIVVLSKSIDWTWNERALLDRLVETTRESLRVIAPLGGWTSFPKTGGVQWMPLEHSFGFFGQVVLPMKPVSGLDGPLVSPVDDELNADRVHGPFSANFRVVWLDDEPVILSPAQAAVFQALWSFGGQPRRGEQIMARAGLKGVKPGDVFKVKTQNKGDPRYEQPRRAYESLVDVNRFAGTYTLKQNI